MFNNRLKDYSIRPPITGLQGGLVGVQDSDSINFSLLLGNILTAVLTNTGVSSGTYGDSTHVPVITVDSQGRITSVSEVAISGGGGSAAWGTIGAGTGVGSQTDLVSYLNSNYFPLPGGTTAQYIRGDGSLATFPSLSGYVPTTRTLTINGTAYDLSTNRTWNVGDVLTSGSYADPSWITSLAWSKITGAPSIPTVGTWGALNYPTWVSGTPFVKMTAAGTFALDTTSYYPNPSGTTAQYVRGDGSLASFPSIPSITGLVPYTGATADVGLGTFSLTAYKLYTTAAAALATPATKYVVLDGTELKTRTPSEVLSDIGAAPLSGIPTLYNVENYGTTSNPYGCLYVRSADKMYVCNNSSNTCMIYSVSTGVLLASVGVTGAFRPLLGISYASGSAVEEVWVTSTSSSNIVRISTTTDASLGSITGASLSGFDIVNYSSTKCFITGSLGSGAMMVINPTTLVVSSTVTTNMSAFPAGMAWNQNAGSSQNGFIVVACQSGILIFNPTTNAVSTTVANPSSAISTGREIRYNPATDKYYVANNGNNSATELSIASSTTFTASKIARNLLAPYSVHIDHTAGYMFVTSVDSNGVTVLLNVFNSTTMDFIMSFKTNAGLVAGAADSSASIDTFSRRIYVTGRRTTTCSVSVVKY
jgi:hypothetical protein